MHIGISRGEEGKCGFVLTPLLIACERQEIWVFLRQNLPSRKKGSLDEFEGKVKREKKSLIIET